MGKENEKHTVDRLDLRGAPGRQRNSRRPDSGRSAGIRIPDAANPRGVGRRAWHSLGEFPPCKKGGSRAAGSGLCLYPCTRGTPPQGRATPPPLMVDARLTNVMKGGPWVRLFFIFSRAG